jgi:hypothetical protein
VLAAGALETLALVVASGMASLLAKALAELCGELLSAALTAAVGRAAVLTENTLDAAEFCAEGRALALVAEEVTTLLATALGWALGPLAVAVPMPGTGSNPLSVESLPSLEHPCKASGNKTTRRRRARIG